MKGHATHRDTVLYRDTQRAPALGWFFVLLVSGVFAITRLAPNAPYEPLLALLFLLSAVLYTFTTLTVEVAKEGVTVWFGLPIDKVFVEVRDILEHRQVDYVPVWWKGPRMSDSTWLFGVNSRGGVALQLSSGRRLLISTDNPDELCAAISRAQLSS